MDALSMIVHLKELYNAQARTNRFSTSRELFQCKMAEGSSVSTHVMIELVEKLVQSGQCTRKLISIDLIQQVLLDSFSQLIMNST